MYVLPTNTFRKNVFIALLKINTCSLLSKKEKNKAEETVMIRSFVMAIPRQILQGRQK